MNATPKVQVTHPDRVMFPADGITKGDLVEHYRHVAPLMLPHVKGRPLTLQRYPRGLKDDGFIQRDVTDQRPPAFVDTVKVPKEGGGTLRCAEANRTEALVWLANQGCLTPHAWLSRDRRLQSPDRLIFDLDPSVAGFAPVRDTALTLRALLTDLGLVPYIKLTGSRGVHVVVPIRVGPDFDTVRVFARDVAEIVVADDPARRTIAARKADRGRRVYVDIQRNAYAQSAVAPYAVRARNGAPVAVPVAWEEISARGMRSDRYRLATLARRTEAVADPWSGLARHARSLEAARHRLDRLRADRT